MLHTLSHLIGVAVGQGGGIGDLTAGQVAALAAVAYVAALAMVRVARRRFFGRKSAMDVVVAVTFGSILGRGVVGNAALGPTLWAAGTRVAIDWLLAAVGSMPGNGDGIGGYLRPSTISATCVGAVTAPAVPSDRHWYDDRS